jgi:carbamoyltransferase
MNVIGISGLHNSVSFKKKVFPSLSPRQYRIAQGFDSAAALAADSGVLAAAAEERFTGEKATGARTGIYPEPVLRGFCSGSPTEAHRRAFSCV